jgi:hypothetical protein
MSRTQHTNTSLSQTEGDETAMTSDDDLRTDRKTASSSVSNDGGPNGDERVELFANSQDYERRWGDIQAGFVDEPRRAVEQADKLVDEVIRSLSETFSNERLRLEGQWSSGDDVSTDDLRIALQRYRSFFHRLLTR